MVSFRDARTQQAMKYDEEVQKYIELKYKRSCNDNTCEDEYLPPEVCDFDDLPLQPHIKNQIVQDKLDG